MTIAGRDDDGIRIEPIPRGRGMYWLIALAIAVPVVITVAAVAILRWSPSSEAGVAGRGAISHDADVVVRVDEPPRVAAPMPSPVSSPGRIVPRRVVVETVADVPAGLGASPVPAPQKPRREIDAADVIEALREEGIHEGIAAFGIPGSHPPKSGILVPEELELPEGYVRHYQSTDEGEQLPAILMFHPDYEFVNELGEVVPLPADGVVTPPLAPPGIDVTNRLHVPERPRGEPIR